MLKTTLWRHQQAAADYMLADARRDAGSHPGAGLWYEMGTGKTLATLAALHAAKARRVLVLAPSVVCATWPKQVSQHWDTDLRCVALTDGSVARRKDALTALWRDTRGEFIAAVNYEAASREPLKSALPKAQWDAVVLDEAHRGKGPTTHVSKWLREKLYPAARLTLALTGTPLPNGYGDAYGLYAAFAPATFDVRNWTHYRNRYAIRGNPRIPQQVTGWQHVADLDARMARHAVSCKAADVLDLPPIMHEWVWVTLDASTASAYRQLETDLIAEMEHGSIVAANALVKALRLQQLAGGVAVTGEGDEATPHRVSREKLDACADLIDGMARSEPVVVFGQFSADVAGTRAIAQAAGRPCYEVSGAAKEQEAWAASAARGEGPVAAVQIAAGGLGINEFVAARFAIFLSTGYSSAAYRQAVARLHRPGQTRPVVIYHVGAMDTIDADIAAALERKEALEDAIMGRLNVNRLHA